MMSHLYLIGNLTIDGGQYNIHIYVWIELWTRAEAHLLFLTLVFLHLFSLPKS